MMRRVGTACIGCAIGWLMAASPLPAQQPGGSGALTITTKTISNGVVSTAFSQTFSATGGTAPYTWSLAGGAVPTGMTLSSSGTLSGTPTSAGTYVFTVKVTDASRNFAVQTFTFMVSTQPLTITTPSPLSSGMVSVPYPTQVLSAAGGVAPYTFSLVSTPLFGSSLPQGLTLSSNGTISGTPTVAGTFQFTVTAADSTALAPLTAAATFSITVRALTPDLTAAAGSVSFTIAAGAAALPPPQLVYVEATEPSTVISWSVAMNPLVNWMTVTPTTSANSTPRWFTVTLTNDALQLAPSSTPYTDIVMLQCLAPSPCAGTSQIIPVSLTVNNVSPALTSLTNLLSFNTPAAAPQPTTQTVSVENSGGGTLSFTSVSCGQSWCIPGSAPASLGGGASANISVEANPSGLNAGFYFTQLTIVSSAGTVTVPVSLLVQSSPSLSASPAGTQIVVPAGGVAANPDTTFVVNVSGAASYSSSVSWTASLLPGASWLTLNTTSGSSTPSTPGVVSYSLNQSVLSTLMPGVYYATIRIASSGAANSPQDFQAVVDVQAANAAQSPNPTPGGLIFTAAVNGPIPAPQNDVVYASSSTPVAYQASAATNDGASWLSVSPSTGTTSARRAASSSISVNQTGLAAGIYHGTVSYSTLAPAVPAVNVTLIVKPAAAIGAQYPAGQPIAKTSAECAPAQIVLTETALVDDFSAPASWPTPLQVQLNDNCGNAVTNGQVVATFSNGDPPLLLLPQDFSSGIYNGTWTPHSTGQDVSVTASANAPGLTPAAELIQGAVIPNQAPAINPGGTVSAFTPQVGQPLAPGTWMAIYGKDLADELLGNNAAVFPATLAGTSVIMGGIESPLYFVSQGQINALIPFELASGQTYQVIVNNNGALSTPASFTATPVSPGIASYASGYAIAQHAADYSLITDSSPARPGEFVIIYLLGMGPTATPVTSGQPSPDGPDRTTDSPAITLNGETVTNIPYSGLTPTTVGLYQIDLQVPADASNGDLTLIVTQGGNQAPPVILPVHN